MEFSALAEEREGRDGFESGGESVVIGGNKMIADRIEEREGEVGGLGSREGMEEGVEEWEVGGSEEARDDGDRDELGEMGGGRDLAGEEEPPFRVRVRVCEG